MLLPRTTPYVCIPVHAVPGASLNTPLTVGATAAAGGKENDTEVPGVRTHARPPQGIVLVSRVALAAVGAGQVAAQLGLSAPMQAALTLVHVYETHSGEKEPRRGPRTGRRRLPTQPDPSGPER